MIELKTWNVLCTFARCGTLLKAAETLHISQPALSKTLAGLESDLGVALFDRTSRNRLKLTPAGENAVKLAGELLEHAQEIEILFRIPAFSNLRLVRRHPHGSSRTH